MVDERKKSGLTMDSWTQEIETLSADFKNRWNPPAALVAVKELAEEAKNVIFEKITILCQVESSGCEGRRLKAEITRSISKAELCRQTLRSTLLSRTEIDRCRAELALHTRAQSQSEDELEACRAANMRQWGEYYLWSDRYRDLQAKFRTADEEAKEVQNIHNSLKELRRHLQGHECETVEAVEEIEYQKTWTDLRLRMESAQSQIDELLKQRLSMV